MVGLGNGVIFYPSNNAPSRLTGHLQMSRNDLNAVLDSLAVTSFPAETVVPVALNLLAGALSSSIAFEGVTGFKSIKANMFPSTYGKWTKNSVGELYSIF